MSDETRAPEPLTEDELHEANGEPLPDREQMSLVRPDPMPITPIDGFEIQPMPPEQV